MCAGAGGTTRARVGGAVFGALRSGDTRAESAAVTAGRRSVTNAKPVAKEATSATAAASAQRRDDTAGDGGTIAGRSIASRSAAGRSVADRSVVGRSVAGEAAIATTCAEAAGATIWRDARRRCKTPFNTSRL